MLLKILGILREIFLFPYSLFLGFDEWFLMYRKTRFVITNYTKWEIGNLKYEGYI